ncbi:MAG: epoxyqueuosine reductase QueH [Tannerellaceae bacterium]|jgi:predicted adenine nucleotide alpha hydrolase (AANH) superfamily ATPase|nr:epoxyqueuosine reductase QueH [Tannerellaceae bacterium]
MMGTYDLVLHVCCAPCSAAILEKLLHEGVRPLVYFFNPNIHPEKEYERRLEEVRRYVKSLQLEMQEGVYDYKGWFQSMQGLENEPERGERCRRCIVLRLEQTARLAAEAGCLTFATSLASSRWKSLEQITYAGQEAEKKYPGTLFLNRNWRRGGLSERRRELITTWGFYNQSFCGCIYSQLPTARRL